MAFLLRLLITAVLLAAALGMNDYAALRWAVFVMTLILIGIDKVEKQVSPGVVWWNVAVAFLFNPIMPIYLYSRPLWVVLDVVAALIILRPMFSGSSKEQSIQEHYLSLTSDKSREKFIMSRNADHLVFDNEEDAIDDIFKEFDDSKLSIERNDVDHKTLVARAYGVATEICVRCKKEMKYNAFSKICKECNEEEIKLLRSGDFKKINELRSKENS